MHQRHQHDQHGADVEEQLEPGGGAFDDRVHHAGGDRAHLRELAAGLPVGVLRHHDQAYQDRGRRADHRRDDEMRRRIGDHRAQQGGVQHQHRPGDAGHAARHHDEELAAREAREIGTDEQRRLHHAEKDVSGGRQPDRAADPERAFEQKGEAAHDRRQDAPVEQQRGEHAHEQHDRQRLQRQHEFRTRHLELEGKLAAAEIAEHEGGAGLAGGGDGIDRVIDHREGMADAGHLEQRDGGEERHHEADRGLLEGDGAAVFAEHPGDGDEREYADRRLQI